MLIEQLTQTITDPEEHTQCMLILYGFPQLYDVLVSTDEFDWADYFGENGSRQVAAFEAYNFDRHHHWLRETLWADIIHASGLTGLPLFVHWGDFAGGLGVARQCFSMLRRMLAERNQVAEEAAVALHMPTWGTFAYFAELPEDDCKKPILSLLEDGGMTFSSADAKYDSLASVGTWFRKRGELDKGACVSSVEQGSWVAKCSHVLVSSEQAQPTAEEFKRSLPSLEDHIAAVTPMEWGSPFGAMFPIWSSIAAIAAVCEKLQCWEEALAWTAAALNPDHQQGGTTLPSGHVQALLSRGRCLSALGRDAEAGEALELASEKASALGLWLYSAYALRDLKLLVLDPAGRVEEGEHASRRLGAVLRRLRSPADVLTKQMKSLDAAELMALPPPASAVDESYRRGLGGAALHATVVPEGTPPPRQQRGGESPVAAGTSVSAASATRQELETMSLMKLHKRAVNEGIEVLTTLKQAMDSADPKQAIISELLLAQQRR